jgi:hypothetical protein
LTQLYRAIGVVNPESCEREEVASYKVKSGHKGPEDGECEKRQEIVTFFIPDEPQYVTKAIYA